MPSETPLGPLTAHLLPCSPHILTGCTTWHSFSHIPSQFFPFHTQLLTQFPSWFHTYPCCPVTLHHTFHGPSEFPPCPLHFLTQHFTALHGCHSAITSQCVGPQAPHSVTPSTVHSPSCFPTQLPHVHDTSHLLPSAHAHSLQSGLGACPPSLLQLLHVPRCTLRSTGSGVLTARCLQGRHPTVRSCLYQSVLLSASPTAQGITDPDLPASRAPAVHTGPSSSQAPVLAN